MRRGGVAVLAILAVLVTASLASAVPTTDQNQPSGPVLMARFSQTDLAQSFQQAHDNIAGAGILLYPGRGTADNVTIALWSNLPNNGGAQLASGTAFGIPGEWVDVLWAPIADTPGATMYLVFTTGTIGREMVIAGDTNPYPFGQVYANPGFQPFPSFDYAFRTYYEPGGAAAVPEPATLLLVVSGALGLAARRKLRR